ncbi:unnamed protein product [Arctia plantaginis]|uniref:ER-bound oxygenase mpaB/mpaB'/Rubber oxygenase catalytic domain-containing protein n=1 Tax=Arctia plantaginis TaxID=874455 RepID=A0A8S0YMX4_ARCPL|nr:unnamed protein product [Arctia plantaginis]CAB3246394.1 unnamed protein product [Arctia plantaginis]
MELSAEEFVEQLLTKEAEEQPCDNVKPEELVIELPKDFDENKFNQGRQFYMEHCFSLSSSMLIGLVAVFSIPSILKILMGTRRSNSVYTAYKRYLATLLHTVSWFEHELKPGSVSWKSLYSVRRWHLQAGMASKLKGTGVLSQRDIALTQFGFIGYSMLRPDNLGVRQLREGDWDAYNYFWRTIGHMIGLEDRYNICRPTFYETVEVCQVLQDRVFIPCLENVPEYFEHLSRVMLDGLWSVNPTVETDGFLYMCRHFTGVPGYIYTESDRIKLQLSLKKCLKGKSIDTGVDTKELMRPAAVQGLPDLPPRLLYYKDYETIETAPAYKALSLVAKFKLFLFHLYMYFYTSYIGRLYFNLNFKFSLFLMRYFPYIAFFRFGIKKSLVNLSQEGPSDDTVPKKNAEYYKKEPKIWYESILSWIL